MAHKPASVKPRIFGLSETSVTGPMPVDAICRTELLFSLQLYPEFLSRYSDCAHGALEARGYARLGSALSGVIFQYLYFFRRPNRHDMLAVSGGAITVSIPFGSAAAAYLSQITQWKTWTGTFATITSDVHTINWLHLVQTGLWMVSEDISFSPNLGGSAVASLSRRYLPGKRPTIVHDTLDFGESRAQGSVGRAACEPLRSVLFPYPPKPSGKPVIRSGQGVNAATCLTLNQPNLFLLFG